LGSWVANQRSRTKQLTDKQIKRLDDLDFVWNKRDYQWEEGINHLVAYKNEFGDCLVPFQFKSNGYGLGNWVRNQRARKEQLTDEQIKRFDDLGFVWKVK